MLKARLNLLGKQFGKLTVIGFAGLDARRNSRWLCVCDCGQQRTHSGCNLKKGKIISCGCSKFGQKVEQRVEDHPDVSVFHGIHTRCYNSKCKEYPRYGGRGIKVCERWRKGGFWVFVADMGPRPSPQHSLDRIDCNGDYSPENCRWATKKEQSRNRRDNKVLEFNGLSMTMVEWSERLGIKYRTLVGRIRKGWPLERAFLRSA